MKNEKFNEVLHNALQEQKEIEKRENLYNDLISRQAALNIRFSDGINENGVLYVPLRDFTDGLKALPSAQPERTCVNCGKTVNNGGWYADGRTRCPIEEHYALLKDGFCHLWEKRNVADDDYPERREDERPES